MWKVGHVQQSLDSINDIFLYILQHMQIIYTYIPLIDKNNYGKKDKVRIIN